MNSCTPSVFLIWIPANVCYLQTEDSVHCLCLYFCKKSPLREVLILVGIINISWTGRFNTSFHWPFSIDITTKCHAVMIIHSRSYVEYNGLSLTMLQTNESPQSESKSATVVTLLSCALTFSVLNTPWCRSLKQFKLSFESQSSWLYVFLLKHSAVWLQSKKVNNSQLG